MAKKFRMPKSGDQVEYIIPAPSPHAGQKRQAWIGKPHLPVAHADHDLTVRNITVQKVNADDFKDVLIPGSKDGAWFDIVACEHDESGKPGTWRYAPA